MSMGKIHEKGERLETHWKPVRRQHKSPRTVGVGGRSRQDRWGTGEVEMITLGDDREEKKDLMITEFSRRDYGEKRGLLLSECIPSKFIYQNLNLKDNGIRR